jgi:hypothetical protein
MYLACLNTSKKYTLVPDLLFADKKSMVGHYLARVAVCIGYDVCGFYKST